MPGNLRWRCVPNPPAHRRPKKPQTPHCIARPHAPCPGVLAYLLSASPSRPHSRPPASGALQSQGGRFVRAQGAGQCFAGGAEVRDGRPSKGRGREPARPSFPYVRTQLSQKCGSRGLRRAPSPPPARPRPRLHHRPLLPPPKPPPPRRPRERPGRAGLQATRFLAAAPCTRPVGTAAALAPGPGGEAPACPGAWCARGAQGPPTARWQREASEHPQAAGGGPGSGLLAYRVRGSGAGGRRGDHGRGCTQALTRQQRQRDGRAQRARLPARSRPPGALGAGRKGRASAGRRSRGGAGPGAAPPPRPAPLGRRREERLVPAGSVSLTWTRTAPHPPGPNCSGRPSPEEPGPVLAAA